MCWGSAAPPCLPCFLSHSSAVLSVKPKKAKKKKVVLTSYKQDVACNAHWPILTNKLLKESSVVRTYCFHLIVKIKPKCILCFSYFGCFIWVWKLCRTPKAEECYLYLFCHLHYHLWPSMHPPKCIKIHDTLIISKNVSHNEAYIIIDASIFLLNTYDASLWCCTDCYIPFYNWLLRCVSKHQ